ncbi:MAG: outer membrane lipoprotein-sorting protein [Acidobacteria bacterium]|nr:outer membrane lipoprotein-sorting protein [Acidobacteriota bacterium]
MKKLVLFAALAVAPFAHAASDPALDKVLHQLDVASTKFQSAEADFRRENYERVVRETTEEDGFVYIQRRGSTPEMGAVITKKAGKPIHNVMQFHNGTLDVFDGASVKHIDAKANRSQYESYLTLGFGGSGKDLAAQWNVTLQGMETIDGVQTAKLLLVAKDPAVRDRFSSVTIWVDPTRGVSLRQIFEMPSHDKITSYYSNIRYNQKVNTSKYKLPK